MDDFYEKFSKIFKGKFKNTQKPLLYCLPTKTKYKNEISQYSKGYIDAGWSAGMFISRGDDGALFADFSVGAEVQETLFHEGTHQLFSSYTGGANVPIWFNEGLATNFESWEIQRSAIQNLHRTLFDSDRRYILFQLYDEKSLLPLDELFKMSSSTWSESSKPQNNYALAWLMVNTLLLEEQGKKILDQWMTGFRQNKTLEQMMNQKLNDHITAMIHDHYRKVLLPLHRLCIPARQTKSDYAQFIEQLDTYTQAGLEEHPFIRFYRIDLDPTLSDQQRIEGMLKLEKEAVFHPELFPTLARLYFKIDDQIKAKRYLGLAKREDPLDHSLLSLME